MMPGMQPGPSDQREERRPGVALRIVASVAAVIAGYVVLVLLSTLVQEDLLGGVSYVDSGLGVLIAAGVLTPLCGIVAGLVTAAIAPRRPVLHAVPMALGIAVETTALYVTGRVDGPLWFESLAGGTLIAAVLAGAWCYGRFGEYRSRKSLTR